MWSQRAPQQRALTPLREKIPSILKQDVILVQALTSPISGIAIILVLFHLIVALVKRRRLNGTEYALAVAIFLECGIWAESLVAVSGSTGAPVYQMTLDGLKRLIKITYAWEINYHLAKLAAEVAALFMLKDIFTLRSRRWRYAWIATLVLIVFTCGGATIVDIVQCIPVEANWDPTVPSKRLSKQIIIIVTNAVVAVPSAFILALAFFMIVRDPVTWKQKLLMLLYWSFGLLLVIFSLGSMISNGSTTVASDYIRSLPVLYIVSVFDVSFGIMLTSIPVLVRTLRKAKSDQKDSVAKGEIATQEGAQVGESAGAIEEESAPHNETAERITVHEGMVEETTTQREENATQSEENIAQKEENAARGKDGAAHGGTVQR